MKKSKKILVAIDLDGIFVGKPPVVSANFINSLYRKTKEKKLVYKSPNSKFQKTIRQISHLRYFRPVVKKNIAWLIKKLKNEKFQIVILSGRYSFLEKLTEKLLQRNGLPTGSKFLKLNTYDEQPHIFKERTIRELKIKYLVDDDIYMLKYLAKNIPETIFIWYANSPYFINYEFENNENMQNLIKINELKELDKIIRL